MRLARSALPDGGPSVPNTGPSAPIAAGKKSKMTDVAERLTKVERDQSHPNLKPRDAATLILVDRSGSTPKVLLGKRHAGLKFMAGKFVFPGGRMEPGDRKMPVASELDTQ